MSNLSDISISFIKCIIEKNLSFRAEIRAWRCHSSKTSCKVRLHRRGIVSPFQNQTSGICLNPSFQKRLEGYAHTHDTYERRKKRTGRKEEGKDSRTIFGIFSNVPPGSLAAVFGSSLSDSRNSPHPYRGLFRNLYMCPFETWTWSARSVPWYKSELASPKGFRGIRIGDEMPRWDSGYGFG